MDRKDFLNSIGISVVTFALTANAAVLSNGGFLVLNGLIVARTNKGGYIAVQCSCTHESYTLTCQSTNSRFYCPNQAATFSENGAVTNGPTSRPLSVYNTQLTGTTLKIYS